MDLMKWTIHNQQCLRKAPVGLKLNEVYHEILAPSSSGFNFGSDGRRNAVRMAVLGRSNGSVFIMGKLRTK